MINSRNANNQWLVRYIIITVRFGQLNRPTTNVIEKREVFIEQLNLSPPRGSRSRSQAHGARARVLAGSHWSSLSTEHDQFRNV